MIDFRKLLRGGARDEVGDAIARLEHQAATLQATIDGAATARRANAAAALSGDGAATRKIEAAERAAAHAKGELERVNIVLEEARARRDRLTAEAAAAERKRQEDAFRHLVKRRAPVAARVDQALQDLCAGLGELRKLDGEMIAAAQALRPDLTRRQPGPGGTAATIRLPLTGVNRSFVVENIWGRVVRAMRHHGLLDGDADTVPLLPVAHKLGQFLPLVPNPWEPVEPLAVAEEKVNRLHLDTVLGTASAEAAAADDEPDPPQAA